MAALQRVAGLFFVCLLVLMSFINFNKNNAQAVDFGSAPISFPKPNSEVGAMALGGDGTLYIGGAFTSIDGIPRNHLAAISPSGTLTSWNPNANGNVWAIAVSGSTVYVAGEFTSVAGTTRNYAAAISTSGSLISGWNPNADDIVSAIAISGSTVYLGGDFTTMGGQSKNFATAVSASTGSVLSWDPDPNDSVFALAIDGSTIYLGGNFTAIGGTTRNRLGAVDTAGTVTSWNPNADSFVATLQFAGGVIYAGGDFTTIGGSQRRRVAAIDAQGVLAQWSPDVNDLVATLQVSGTTVYLGGDFTSINGTTRNFAGAVTTSGALANWNPNPDDSVSSILAGSTKLYIGGLFTQLSGQVPGYFAAFNMSGAPTGDTIAPQAAITAPANNATVSGTINVTATASDNVGITKVNLYLDGSFLATDTTSPYSFSWNTSQTGNGSHNLVAKAYDAAGNIGTSSTITVTVSGGTTQPPPASGQVATPMFTPNGGTFSDFTTVVITDSTDGATIHYTIDGTDPTESSPTYQFSVFLGATTTVKARAFKAGSTSSAVATAAFIKSGSPPPDDSCVSLNCNDVVLPAGTSAGDIVKFTGNPTVYLVQNDGLHAFDTYESFLGYVAAFHKSIININNVPESYTMGVGFARQAVNIPPAPANQYPTGTLVNQSGTIYLIIGGDAVPFTNFAAFTGLGYQLKYVTKNSIAGYRVATSYRIESPSQAHPWGSWLRVDATHYYYAHETGLIRSPSPTTFYDNGGQGKFILPANAADLAVLAAYPDLAPLVSHDSRVY